MAVKTLLVAEDNPDDAFIFQMMYRKAALPHQLHMVSDGQEVINWLEGREAQGDRASRPIPDLLVLDLKMPMKTGLEVLEWIRGHPQFQSLPTVILSSSDDPKDLQRATELGAEHYFVKSPHLRDVMQFLRAAD